MEELLKVTGALSTPGLLLVEQKCPFHSLPPSLPGVVLSAWVHGIGRGANLKQNVSFGKSSIAVISRREKEKVSSA